MSDPSRPPVHSSSSSATPSIFAPSHLRDSHKPPPAQAWLPHFPAAFSHDLSDPVSATHSAWDPASTARPLLAHHPPSSSSPQFRQAAPDRFEPTSGPSLPLLSTNVHPPKSPKMQLEDPAPPILSVPSDALSIQLVRDAMMAYAYHLYSSPGPGSTPLGLTSAPILYTRPESEPSDHVYRRRLLPLLLTLAEHHPRHLPILLLLACAYYALGDFDASLATSHRILSIDAQYVEAMGNIGTTMQALGQTEKAYEWWWKALQLRPTYWDALDNIIGTTLSLARTTQNHRHRLAYYRQTLHVCQYVQQRVLDSNHRLVYLLQPSEVPRLQRTVFTSATIYATLGPTNTERAILEQIHALELVIRSPQPCPEAEQYTIRDLLLATCVAGHIMCSTSDAPSLPDLSEIIQMDLNTQLDNPTFHPLHLVRTSGDQLLTALLRKGGGVLPLPLLSPEQVLRFQSLLFPQSKGVLSAICTRGPSGEWKPPDETVCGQANSMTSTVLLTLAKRFQDSTLHIAVVPGSGGDLRVNTTIVVLLYYLALAWAPAPSTYNNLGIVLSGINDFRKETNGEILNGISFARMFYTAGLQLDPKHPHLLTNLGSLLKDQGKPDQAIRSYLKAIEHKPDFDIALANLGNAIKDVGKPWEAIQYYRRALATNSTMPEAICGLANSLCAICDWRGRGSVAHEIGVDDEGYFTAVNQASSTGWITETINVTDVQLKQGLGDTDILSGTTLSAVMEEYRRSLERAKGRQLRSDEISLWDAHFRRLLGNPDERAECRINDTGFLIRFIDWVLPQLQRRWYIIAYGTVCSVDQTVPVVFESLTDTLLRPTLPKAIQAPFVPSILPFHTFMYPVTPVVTRLIPHRSALRISYTVHSQPWIPRHVYSPPRPPVGGKINIAYLSNDVNNHPLSHLMQSVFGMHDREQFNVTMYTTSPWDGTVYRPRIASMVEHFIDVSKWSLPSIISHISQQEIHILINLGGYTKGSRNEICAARACPVQIQLMGYAGSLGAGWCDYLVCDPIVCPQEMSASERWRKGRTQRQQSQMADSLPPSASSPLDLGADLDPEVLTDDWVYTEKLIYMPHTYMVADHKQAFRGDENLSPEERAQVSADILWRDEERRRADGRKRLFPDVPQDVTIFANFNQLYKVDPGIFLIWLRILRKVPHSMLWLLRFPAAGEEHLLRAARQWAGEDVASRIRFTDVANKDWHIYRARIADLFLDTAECSAHTIAADVLWTGTPVLTWPKYTYKMCSRVAASMVSATGFGDQMIVNSAEQYESRAVALAQSVHYVPHHEESGETFSRGQGELMQLRRNLFLNRDNMPLFDTLRWTRNLEKGLREAWRRWVEGTQFETSDEWEACDGAEKQSGCIWIQDDDPVNITRIG